MRFLSFVVKGGFGKVLHSTLQVLSFRPASSQGVLNAFVAAETTSETEKLSVFQNVSPDSSDLTACGWLSYKLRGCWQSQGTEGSKRK